MRTKGAEESAKTYGRMITKTKPLKLWSDEEPSSRELSKYSVEAKALTLTPRIVKRKGHLQNAIFANHFQQT